MIVFRPLAGIFPSAGFSRRLAPRIAEFLHVLYFGNFLALAQSTSLFTGGAMDAVGALTAVFFYLTWTALHASVAPLRLIAITA